MFNNFKIHIINLKEHIDRWNNVVNEMNKFNITTYERFEGIKCEPFKTLPVGITYSLQRLNGEAGCRKSHINIIKKAKEQNLDRVMIFEDDVYFNDKITEYENIINNFIDNNNYDLFYLGCNFNQSPTIQISEYIKKVSFAWTTHCYIVNKNVYDKIIQYENNIEPIDIVYNSIQKEGNSYCINPRLAYQRAGKSYILNQNVNYDIYLKDRI